MQETVTWRELEHRFRAMDDISNGCGAKGKSRPGVEVPWTWQLKDFDPAREYEFRTIAEIAGELYTPRSDDPFTAWLEALRKNKVKFKYLGHTSETMEDGTTSLLAHGRVSSIIFASVELCWRQQPETERGVLFEVPKMRMITADDLLKLTEPS
jgi:hypothetical protein